MDANTSAAPVHDRHIRLRTAAFDAWCQRSLGGRVTQAGVAARLGMHPTTLNQYRTGRRPVGAAAIIAIRDVLPGATFEDLFEVVRS